MVMDWSDIERIKITHRPWFWWLGIPPVFGCRCGSREFPCSALVTALEAERHAVQPHIERLVTELIRRQYGGSARTGMAGR
ncbi:hypothetical protein Pme01_26910 [Planosporangium mesophilum]|uniref:Uncharacterized protein n=1 Tax=Planosporangium mesophilum TaxID=689768 RepID=A0A8J3TB48_9ACTN|nr:hypothetical protein Pme01_26910 [Planosporangium mesophilum]